MSFEATLKSEQSISREAVGDALLISLALLQGLLLLSWPSVWIIALGLWWGSNTVAHNAIHRPFFRTRFLNQAFSFFLTLVLGVPQSLWKTRHLAHHAGRAPRFPKISVFVVELLAAAAAWIYFRDYLLGYVIGLGLCYLQGHYEHAAGTTSHYGALYNFVFLNDGFHVEHHASPGRHWTALRDSRARDATESRWPAVLRWLDMLNLTTLEKAALKMGWARSFLIRSHERAFRRALPVVKAECRIGIVGGGLFPRTALVLLRLFPRAKVTIIDMSETHLQTAKTFLGDSVEWIGAKYDPEAHGGFDVVVFPLALAGNRESLYRRPPAPVTVLHDWVWNRRGTSSVVSWLLLKRVNVVSCER